MPNYLVFLHSEMFEDYEIGNIEFYDEQCCEIKVDD